MQSRSARCLLFALLAVTLASPLGHGARAANASEVNVYAYRQPYLIDPPLKKLTEDTGIKVNVIFAEKSLIGRMAAEGRSSPADLLLTVDISNLMQAKEAGFGQVVHSPSLEKEIPAAGRDKEGVWWGLTRRARVVYASKERVKLNQITYEDLADPSWHGKICIRSGQHVHNVAMTASMIAAHGETWTEQWLKGVKENLARKPAGDDRMQVKGIYSGECDIADGNTYYMGAMLQNDKEPEQKEWPNSVYILFPNTNDRRTHVNIFGAVQNAPHKGQRAQADGIPGVRRGPRNVRRGGQRIPGEGRHPVVAAGQILGGLQTRSDLAQRDRRLAQEGERTNRQDRLRRRTGLMSGTC
jgi:iron(III) transport system substrate-binding protein